MQQDKEKNLIFVTGNAHTTGKRRKQRWITTQENKLTKKIATKSNAIRMCI
jgi:hypothetical protein